MVDRIAHIDSLLAQRNYAVAGSELIALWHEYDQNRSKSGVKVTAIARRMKMVAQGSPEACSQLRDLRDAIGKRIDKLLINMSTLDWLVLNEVIGDDGANAAWHETFRSHCTDGSISVENLPVWACRVLEAGAVWISDENASVLLLEAGDMTSASPMETARRVPTPHLEAFTKLLQAGQTNAAVHLAQKLGETMPFGFLRDCIVRAINDSFAHEVFLIWLDNEERSGVEIGDLREQVRRILSL